MQFNDVIFSCKLGKCVGVLDLPFCCDTCSFTIWCKNIFSRKITNNMSWVTCMWTAIMNDNLGNEQLIELISCSVSTQNILFFLHCTKGSRGWQSWVTIKKKCRKWLIFAIFLFLAGEGPPLGVNASPALDRPPMEPDWFDMIRIYKKSLNVVEFNFTVVKSNMKWLKQCSIWTKSIHNIIFASI